jgi:tetrahydromethanopterin S-methyltransferase subunit A
LVVESKKKEEDSIRMKRRYNKMDRIEEEKSRSTIVRIIKKCTRRGKNVFKNTYCTLSEERGRGKEEEESEIIFTEMIVFLYVHYILLLK